jgi:hypothetical protein
MKQNSSAPLQFRGEPGRLTTVLRLPATAFSASADLTSCSVDLPGVTVRRAKIRELGSAERGLSLLKIKLPRSTAPGVYKGTVEVAGKAFPIEVNVEPTVTLRLFPDDLSTTAAPGAVITFNLTVLNEGNSAVNLDKEYTFCVFERGGIDRALFHALATDQVKGEKRLDRLLDELAAAHGGLVRVEIASADLTIPYGESRDFQVSLRLPDRLRPGRTYSGAWKFEKTSFAVEIKLQAKIQERPK